MSKRSKVKPAAIPRPGARRTVVKRRRGWLVGTILLSLLAASAWWVGRLERGPTPPLLNTEGHDPAVARLIASATRDVESTPESGAAWGRLGAAFFAYGFDAPACTALEQAGRLAPREPRWPYRLALVQIEMGASPDLIRSNLQTAVELCRDQPDMPRLRLAQFLLEHGQADQARPHFEQLLRLQPAHPSALLGLARVRLAEGRAADSLELVTRCASDPHVARSAQALLAQLQQRLGNPGAAEAAGRQSASLPPDQPWPDPYLAEYPDLRVGRRAMMEAAQELIEARRFDEALKVLGTVTNDYPQAPEAYYGIGLLLNQRLRNKEAEAVLRENVRLDPDSAHGHEQLALALMAQQRFADATGALQRAVQLMPTLGRAHHQLGVACARLGQPDEAIAHLREATRIDPKDVESHGLLADMLSVRGRYAEAAETLAHAIQLRPTWARARFNLGYVCAQMGKPEEAIPHLREAINQNPNDADSYVLLAEILNRRGETNEAARLLRQAQVIGPADKRAQP